jgi:oligopeptidase A
MNDTTNPLLAPALPDFAAVRPEHVKPAIELLLADADAALDRAIGDDVAADYDALSAVLDVPVERLRRAWGAVVHLQAVASTSRIPAAPAGSRVPGSPCRVPR